MSTAMAACYKQCHEPGGIMYRTSEFWEGKLSVALSASSVLVRLLKPSTQEEMVEQYHLYFLSILGTGRESISLCSSQYSRYNRYSRHSRYSGYSRYSRYSWDSRYSRYSRYSGYSKCSTYSRYSGYIANLSLVSHALKIDHIWCLRMTHVVLGNREIIQLILLYTRMWASFTITG